MQFIVFTKMFKEFDLDGLIDKVKYVGADGMDLCVRPEYVVTPESAGTELAPAVEKIRAAGLDVPMITANFDFVDPGMEGTEPMLAAMDAADVRLIKLGYYSYKPGEMDFWKKVEDIRAKFEKYEKLAAAHNVTICYHTHSDLNMGNNASAIMALLEGRDPAYMAAYLDTAHIMIDGEPWPMALDIVGPYLKIVAAKDFVYEKEEGQPAKIGWVPAGEGLLQWPELFRELIKRDFDGPVSIHGEFERGFDSKDEFFDVLRDEVACIRKAYQEAEQS
ncbi:sugar phosphate isomerase/epimerase family protein [Planctomycetota bacterium]